MLATSRQAFQQAGRLLNSRQAFQQAGRLNNSRRDRSESRHTTRDWRLYTSIDFRCWLNIFSAGRLWFWQAGEHVSRQATGRQAIEDGAVEVIPILFSQVSNPFLDSILHGPERVIPRIVGEHVDRNKTTHVIHGPVGALCCRGRSRLFCCGRSEM